MTAADAQKILNEHSSGKVYTLEEAAAYLELCSKLAQILEDHPIEKELTSNLKVA